jgi:acetolactate synthase regulatory subunit
MMKFALLLLFLVAAALGEDHVNGSLYGQQQEKPRHGLDLATDPRTVVEKQEHVVVEGNGNLRRNTPGTKPRPPSDDGDRGVQAEAQAPITRLKLDVAVRLGGEMGNHLGQAATAKIIQWMVEQDEYLRSNIDLQVRYISCGFIQAKSATSDLETCFPSAFHPTNNGGKSILMEFDQHQTKNRFNELVKDQEDMIRTMWQPQEAEQNANTAGAGAITGTISAMRGVQIAFTAPDEAARKMTVKTACDITTLKYQLHHLWEVTQRMQHSGVPVIASNTTRTDAQGRPTLSSPFLTVAPTAMAGIPLVDLYYEQIRDFFVWDYSNPRCCHESMPDPDETVLHARGFRAESMGAAQDIESKIAELTPERTATELLGHLSAQNKDRVAIVSRFDASYMQPFVDALALRGIPAQSVDGHSGVQDFCFLLKTTHSAVGTARSTYLQWATILSSSLQSAHLSSMSWETSPHYLNRTGRCSLLDEEFQATNAAFRNRITFHSPVLAVSDNDMAW